MKKLLFSLAMLMILVLPGCKKDKNITAPEGQFTKFVKKYADAIYLNKIIQKPNGNMVLAGYLFASIDLGGGTRTPMGDDIIFLELDNEGNYVKDKVYNIAGDQYLFDIEPGPSNTFYVSGDYTGSVNFGTGNFASNGGYDMYIGKLDADFNFTLARSFGSVEDDYPSDLAVDGSGNVYITGDVGDDLDFGGGNMSINETTTFALKLNPNLNYSWANEYSAGIGKPNYGNAIALDPTGSYVYIGGEYVYKASFGGLTHNALNSNAEGFLIKLNSSGAYQWDMVFPSDEGSSVHQVETDANGNVYTGMYVIGITTVGLTPYTYISGGSLLAKITSAGSVTFVKTFKSTYNNMYSKFELNGNRIAVVLANLGTMTIARGGTPFSYLAVFDLDGNLVWSKDLKSSNLLYSDCVFPDSDGRIWLFGYLYGTFDFNNEGSTVAEGNQTFNPAELFLVKY